MAGQVGCSSSVPSLPPPCPKSPPEYPDLYGKRRETAKVQMLEREIGFLEEELRSVERIQPSSTCCKEVADFVVANPDPLIPTNRKNRRSCRFWKWLCEIPCFNFSWICCCCYGGCSIRLEMPRCWDCCSCNCSPCACLTCPNCPSCPTCSCLRIPKWQCWQCSSCLPSRCCKRISCSRNCCIFPICSWPECCCCRCKCKCNCKCTRPKCPKVHPCNCCSCSCSCCSCCCCCTKTCCNPFQLCF
ncbi:guanine nucleotide-binding protein subunit gamma 3 [Ziziphus jujuba]|uniref:Guanine nucleotide-binding protein subunit gamma 3 n=1 Tax=Ziziphus jujuba TaxID=326968 RepID=A0A6P4A546_ZIZJJ|nr:guanine nucleotide-binding protein subunit gamma 3 [Ziziphus jujuba]